MGAWVVQVADQHLGIAATMDGAAGTITFAPTRLGLQPAVYTDGDGEEVQPFDAVCIAPFRAGSGLRGSDLTHEPRDLLIEVVANWVRLPTRRPPPPRSPTSRRRSTTPTSPGPVRRSTT